MKAVILNAGSGTRLRPYTETRPKSLVKIADKTILEYQIEILEKLSVIDEVIIVTGYLENKIVEFVKSKYYNLKITILNNIYYQTTNSFYSFSIASSRMNGHDFILLNGDLIFDFNLVNEFLYSEKSAILVDPNLNYEPYEMNVEVWSDTTKIKNISKNIPFTRYYGRSLQIILIKKADSKALIKDIDNLLLIEDNKKNAFPVIALKKLINDQKISAFHPNKYYTWFEIDTVEDYLAANKHLRSLKSY